jgi:hypothetical protein
MSVELIPDDRNSTSPTLPLPGSARVPGEVVRPFVLKWAEETPESLLGSLQSVFSPPVNGLDVCLAVLEPDHCESTGNQPDNPDSTTPH